MAADSIVDERAVQDCQRQTQYLIVCEISPGSGVRMITYECYRCDCIIPSPIPSHTDSCIKPCKDEDSSDSSRYYCPSQCL